MERECWGGGAPHVESIPPHLINSTPLTNSLLTLALRHNVLSFPSLYVVMLTLPLNLPAECLHAPSPRSSCTQLSTLAHPCNTRQEYTLVSHWGWRLTVCINNSRDFILDWKFSEKTPSKLGRRVGRLCILRREITVLNLAHDLNTTLMLSSLSLVNYGEAFLQLYFHVCTTWILSRVECQETFQIILSSCSGIPLPHTIVTRAAPGELLFPSFLFLLAFFPEKKKILSLYNTPDLPLWAATLSGGQRSGGAAAPLPRPGLLCLLPPGSRSLMWEIFRFFLSCFVASVRSVSLSWIFNGMIYVMKKIIQEKGGGGHRTLPLRLHDGCLPPRVKYCT